MKKLSSFFRNRPGLLLMVPALIISQAAWSRQEPEGEFYPLKKDFTSKKDMEHAAIFLHLLPENDTTYVCRYYNKNGSMIRQETFLDSGLTITNGRFCWYDKDGNIDSTGLVYRGLKNGIWKYYDDSVKITLSLLYDHGKQLEKREYQNDVYADKFDKITDLLLKENIGYTSFAADSMLYKNIVSGAADPDTLWKYYLKKNIAVPERLINARGFGDFMVTASFTVNEEGRMEDIFLLRSSEWSADAEVFQAIRACTLWAGTAKKEGPCTLQQSFSFYCYADNNSPFFTKNGVYIGTQIPAKFPGGDKGWSNFLYRYLNSSIALNNNAPVGRYDAVISFVVEKDGTVSDIETLTNPGYGTAEEVARVIKKSPRWTPATIDGRPVKYTQKQAISFFCF